MHELLHELWNDKILGNDEILENPKLNGGIA